VTVEPDGVAAANGLVLWQRVEGAGVFAAGIAIYLHGGIGWPWWLAVMIFFAPDLSFAAYPLGPRVGARVYNAAHVYALGALLLAGGFLGASPVFSALGALWLAHVGFDRMLSYGLKSERGFNDTHLGRIGRAT
jgi:hypothetical protein